MAKVKFIHSTLNPSIKYKEQKKMFDDDIGHDSSLYEIEILDTTVVITLGRIRIHPNSNIAYYPIYIVGEKNGFPVVRSQIGVFELFTNQIADVNNDGDINIDKLENLLLYTFVDRKFLEKVNSKPPGEKPVVEKVDAELEEKPVVVTKEVDSEEVKQDDIFLIDSSPTTTIPKDKYFTIIKSEKKEPLQEETKESSDEIMAEYDKLLSDKSTKKKDQWLNNIMKNPNYAITETASNGDCFFDTVRLAFKEIGYLTDIETLRQIVADEATESIFRHNKDLYQMFFDGNKSVIDEIKNLKIVIEKDKGDIEKEKNKKNKEKLVKIANENIAKYNRLINEDLAQSKELLKEYKHMEKITNLNEYKKFIMTSTFWADAWAIHIIEKKLNVKMIIFSEEIGTEQIDPYNIVQCGYSMDSDNEQFRPNYYILACYDGSHYRLITYCDHSILTFREIPYHLKILIVKKCMEGNSGIFHSIEDFNDFKSRLGIDYGGTGGTRDSLGKNKLTFHELSKHLPPGRGPNEHIDERTIQSFAHLASIENWRLLLDDSFEKDKLINIDNRYWKSVEHYLLACPYKKRFDDIYLKFSKSNNASDNTDISDSLKKARKAIKKNGVSVDGKLMPATLVVGDSDSLGDERKNALRKKFGNPDCKNVLLATNDAVLQHFVSGKPPVQDTLLMEIREELKNK